MRPAIGMFRLAHRALGERHLGIAEPLAHATEDCAGVGREDGIEMERSHPGASDRRLSPVKTSTPASLENPSKGFVLFDRLAMAHRAEVAEVLP